eukprot:5848975-Pyramimonas_sp.AAC.2
MTANSMLSCLACELYETATLICSPYSLCARYTYFPGRYWITSTPGWKSQSYPEQMPPDRPVRTVPKINRRRLSAVSVTGKLGAMWRYVSCFSNCASSCQPYAPYGTNEAAYLAADNPRWHARSTNKHTQDMLPPRAPFLSPFNVT